MLRWLWSPGTVSLAGGIGGGLLAGWIVSKQAGGWLTPLPWIVYVLVLAAAVTAISLLWPPEKRRSGRHAGAGDAGAADHVGNGG